MSSVTGTLNNNTSFTVYVSAGTVSHGETPKILQPEVASGDTQDIFLAQSDGAGVDGHVLLNGNGVTWDLHYDNPVAGSNHGSVSSPDGYGGSLEAGSGTNATFNYGIEAD